MISKQEIRQYPFYKETLPPTPISPAARQTLSEWGVSSQWISFLREIASSFRYDLCIPKMKRICSHGGIVFQKNHESHVLLSHFDNVQVRLDGACGTLTCQFVNMLYTTSILDQLNNALTNQGKSPLCPYYLRGLSQTYFNNPEGGTSQHYWSGFLPKKNISSCAKNMVFFDVSFQNIQTAQESGYQPSTFTPYTSTCFEINKHNTLRIGNMDPQRNDSILNNHYYASVLGVSYDWKLVYELCFVQDRHRTFPALIIMDSTGKNTELCLLSQDKQRVDFTPLSSSIPFKTQQEVEEIRTMLCYAHCMPLEYNQKKAEHFLRQNPHLD